MSISDATLRTDVWTTIRSILVGKIKVTNTTTSATKTASVLATYNDKRPSLPQVVMPPIELSKNEFKFGENQGKRFINITIYCYYEDSVGVDQMANIVDSTIIDAIEDKTLNDIEMVALSEDSAFMDPNQSKYQLKTMVYTFLKE